MGCCTELYIIENGCRKKRDYATLVNHAVSAKLLCGRSVALFFADIKSDFLMTCSSVLSFTDWIEADLLLDEGEKLSSEKGQDYIPLSSRIDW